MAPPILDRVDMRTFEPILPAAKQLRDRHSPEIEQGARESPPEQLAWLGFIRNHVATSLSIEPEDFEYAPFSQKGGLGKVYQVFGSELNRLLDELNEVLAA